MKIEFKSGNEKGYSVVTKGGKQYRPTYICKETFALDASGRVDIVDGPVFRFLRKDGIVRREGMAKHQEKVLHCFERAMGFSPLATCEVATREYATQRYDYGTYRYVNGEIARENFFLYTVSTRWRESIPLLHILALLTRNYYPMNQPLGWRKILNYFHWAVNPTIEKLVERDGELIKGVNVVGCNGISDYHSRIRRATLAR